MSRVKIGNQHTLSASALGASRMPRRQILGVADGLLWDIERSAGAGEEILWSSLRLTTEARPGFGGSNLEFRVTVEMHRDDVVAGFSAMALAEHERSKL